MRPAGLKGLGCEHRRHGALSTGSRRL